MSIFEKFKSKPKKTDQERWAGIDKENAARVEQERAAAREQARKEDAADLEQAKEKFQKEKPKLEQRLQEIPKEIEDKTRIVAELTGPDMRKILDQEYKLNSALSPVDSTDSSRQREYEMWVQANEDGRRAVKSQKADLGVRIDKYRKQIRELEVEKTEIERRIQRGY